MAAPNLKQPITITGKTAVYAVTASLGTVLSNAAASGKVLKINSVYCANVDGVNTADLDLTYYDGAVDSYISYRIAVPAKASQVLVTRDTYLYLEEGKSLRASANAAGDLVLTIGYEEIS